MPDRGVFTPAMEVVTDELLEAGQSSRGGWSRAQLELIGVDWRPKKGWRGRVLGSPITWADAQEFRDLKDQHLEE